MTSKIKIIKSAIKMVEQKGIKFSMIDIAKDLSTSKRTIYEHFESKKQLIDAVIDYLFDEIATIHNQILEENISEFEKLKKILLVYPTSINMDKLQLDTLVETHADIYKKIDSRLSSNWDLTLMQLDKCIKEGSIKSINKTAFRDIILSIYEKTIKHTNHKEMLNICIDIVFNGIKNQ